MGWHANVLSYFPELFPGMLGISVIGRALQEEIWSLEAYNVRDFAADKHQTVDDAPYGGGGGMVARADVIGNALDHIQGKTGNLEIIYLSPRGELLNQKIAGELASGEGNTIICGRFEGLDERAIQYYNIRELSIGDYVLSCGDAAAFVLLDCVVRLLPGVLGGDRSLDEESFACATGYAGLLEYPHYTKPREWRGLSVPDTLISGHHAEVARWRLSKAKEKTRTVRPDLWAKYIVGGE